MNLLESLIPSALAETIGTTFMHSIWEVAAVALLLLIVLQIVPRKAARVRYHLGVASLLLMLALPVATFIMVHQPAVETTEVAPDLSFLLESGQIMELEKQFAAKEAGTTFLAGISEFFNENAHLLFALWMFGALFFSGRFILGYFQVQRLRHRNTEAVPSEVTALLASLQEKMGLKRTVRLLQSGSVDTPMVIGALRPVILLPIGLLSGLTPEQVECILAHELAHIRRWDYLVNIFQSLVEIVLFFHPAVWWVSRLVREERENCCDETVLALKNNNMVYARALLNLETLRSKQPELAMSSTGGSLFKRIKRITGAESRETKFYSRGLFVAMLTLTFVLVLSSPGSDEIKASTPMLDLNAPEVQWEEKPVDDQNESSDDSSDAENSSLKISRTNEDGEQINLDLDELPENMANGLQSLLGLVAEIPTKVVGDLPDMLGGFMRNAGGNFEKQVDEEMFSALLAELNARQDTPVTKLMFQDNGKNVIIAMNADGEIEDVRVDGESVPRSEYGTYKRLANRSMRKYLSKNDPMPAPPSPPGNANVPAPPTPPDLGNLPPMPPLPRMGKLPPVPAPPAQGNMSDEEYERVMEKYGEEMEEWGERVEAQFENGDWERFGEAMEAWGERVEEQFDNQDWSKFEQEMERWGEQLGAELEAAFEGQDWEKFGRDMEAWGERFAEQFGDGERWEAWGEELARGMEEVAAQLEEQLSNLDLSDAERARDRAARDRERTDRERAKAEKYRSGVNFLIDEMVRDGLVKEDKSFRIKINEDELFVNGKRQSGNVHRKYRRIIEDRLGIDVGDEMVEINLKKGNKSQTIIRN